MGGVAPGPGRRQAAPGPPVGRDATATVVLAIGHLPGVRSGRLPGGRRRTARRPAARKRITGAGAVARPRPVVSLPDGLVLRTLAPDDIDQVAALLAARGEPADGVDLELIAADPDAGADSIGVVVDAGRVVSTLTVLDETLVLDGLPVPAGQVELVATDPAYEGRGLVRALMRWAHERSRRRGHLAHVMVGIPFFYRQFGYAYTIPIHRWRRLERTPPIAEDLDVRPATPADIPAMAALQAAEQRRFRLSMPHSDACWRWLVARDGTQQWVAERGGAVVATARTTPPADGVVVGEVAAVDAAAAAGIVAQCRQATDADVVVQERPGTVAGAAVEPLLAPVTGRADWYYARVADLAALLAHLAPVLHARLVAAGLGDRRHDVLLSTYRSHLRFVIGPDGMSEPVVGGPLQAPVSAGGSGVPPDGVAPLVLGPYGAVGLEERVADCNLGRQRELMAALFPPLPSDLLTYYLPV
jgi:predicted N-acetyltransferase YhbS